MLFLLLEFIPYYERHVFDYFTNKRDGPVPTFKEFFKNKSFEKCGRVHSLYFAYMDNFLSLLDAMDEPSSCKLSSWTISKLMPTVNVLDTIDKIPLIENLEYVKIPSFEYKNISYDNTLGMVAKEEKDLLKTETVNEDIILSYNSLTKIIQYLRERGQLRSADAETPTGLLVADEVLVSLENIYKVYSKIKEADEFNKVSYLTAKDSIISPFDEIL